MKKLLLIVPFAFASCYDVERDCKDFKTGTFEFTAEINGVKKTTTFERTEDREIDFYDGKSDTATVRWVNDCEFVLQKLHPKTMAEKQAIAMKILTTSKNSYTFEYGVVGSDITQKGTAVKIK
ncbi:MAG: DNA topoisomerase IV [Flavobacterium sp.]|uniref:DNA topoisomerase IV n=1 Tax=Flavobacterium sp. TaxID=239 RepID=UPI00120B8BBC|nr:DNA topoisomerase IV [Flavobacterium sp.]RZJ67622.1 MAG: DNA topoisomerase IV [Flavobacterium sp.]